LGTVDGIKLFIRQLKKLLSCPTLDSIQAESHNGYT
jgi:hypothetical protein